ncbi:uncharacterized protein LOC127388705 [Apus apus]|uniref:uncharacterized protein LOC127388705 n=1 Tax=Apus apus TaxID=8895 RepID=UPI0021F859AD|nr:uncharacterized protein LOC127388705 [Apus apus]
MTSRPARPGEAAAAGPAVQKRPAQPPSGLQIPAREKGLSMPMSSFLQLATVCLALPSDISRRIPACFYNGPREEVALAHEHRGFLHRFGSRRSSHGEGARATQGAGDHPTPLLYIVFGALNTPEQDHSA